MRNIGKSFLWNVWNFSVYSVLVIGVSISVSMIFYAIIFQWPKFIFIDKGLWSVYDQIYYFGSVLFIFMVFWKSHSIVKKGGY
jgi:hypothetical protein